MADYDGNSVRRAPRDTDQVRPTWPRMCPGLPSHTYDGPCGHEAAPGDRYCDGCRAEFDATLAVRNA